MIGLVATFGAYADLAGVIQAATTGTSLVDGERFGWEPDPRAREVVADQLLDLLPAEAAQQVEQALEGTTDPASLPAELAAVHELLTTDDPSASRRCSTTRRWRSRTASWRCHRSVPCRSCRCRWWPCTPSTTR
jgi:hypothetical protein